MFKDRQIVHLDLDSFFVSVERLKNSALKGKPVIIGGSSDRGVVASCSYEARRYGVSSAMPSKMAKALCPDAIFVKGNMEEYEKYSAMVTEILKERSPVLEKASIDEHYIDVSGMDKFFNSMKWMHELKDYVQDKTGLPLSYGLSANKTVAKIATNEAKPNGELMVAKQMVQPFLDPLAVKKIPGIGMKTYTKLSSMGVEKIRTLTQIPAELMYKILGQSGISIWQKAHGEDDSPVVPYQERKSIGTETTFESDTIDTRMIKEILTAMVTDLTYQLRSQCRLASCITVKLRYSDFETVSKQRSIHYTSLDSHFIPEALNLFDSLYNKRMLIRLVGVKLSHFVSGYQQIDLLDTASERYHLYQAMDHIRKRFGSNSVKIASSVPQQERNAGQNK